MIKRETLYGLLLTLLFFSHAINAQCVPGFENGSFGSVSSLNIKDYRLMTSTKLTVKCDLVLTSLLSSDNIIITFNNASSLNGLQAALKNTAPNNNDIIPINVCTDSDCSTKLKKGEGKKYSSASLATLLGGSTFTMPFYFQTNTGYAISAGTYQVKLDLLIKWDICGLAGVANLCLDKQQGQTIISPIITLIVTNDCIFSYVEINFGSAISSKGFSDLQGIITLDCTKGSVYTVGIDDGKNSDNTMRYMVNSRNRDRIPYEIYQGNSKNKRWGKNGDERWPSNNASNESSDQMIKTYNYLATVLKEYTVPVSPGTYRDSLTVDVIF